MIAQSTFADATARGKAIVIAEAANSGRAPLPEEEAKEDEVEEVLAIHRTNDNMYMCRASGTTNGLFMRKSQRSKRP